MAHFDNSAPPFPSPGRLRHMLDDAMHESEDRRYLGMSRIADCPRALYNAMLYGAPPPAPATRRYCHEGLLHEADILERLQAAVGEDLHDIQRELIAPFDDRFRGHIDGAIADTLIEIKSVSDLDKLRQVQDYGALDRHTWQVQAYMAYSDYRRAYVIYKARATGSLWIVSLYPDPQLAPRIESKARMILDAVDSETPPNCTCGRCPR